MSGSWAEVGKAGALLAACVPSSNAAHWGHSGCGTAPRPACHPVSQWLAHRAFCIREKLPGKAPGCGERSQHEGNFLSRHQAILSCQQGTALQRNKTASRAPWGTVLLWKQSTQIRIIIIHIYICISCVYPLLSSQLRPCSPRRTWSHPDRGGFSLSAHPPMLHCVCSPSPTSIWGLSAQHIQPCIATRGRISQLQHWASLWGLSIV